MCIRDSFKGIFKAMAGCPVTVRLLDPPLHEFVPHDLKGQQEMADTMGVSLQYIQQRVESVSYTHLDVYKRQVPSTYISFS